MIATADDGRWIRPAESGDGPPLRLAFPTAEAQGRAALEGAILDTKCWFGAMRPGEGKVHKACASLCIRSGLPPAIYTRSLRATPRLLILTDEAGRTLGDGLLPFVADRIRLEGEVVAQGDLTFLRTSLDRIRRLGRP